jgi:hypothetical protein
MKKQAPKKHWQVKLVNGEKCLIPYCEDAKKKVDEYKNNQITHFNPVAETDWRSAKQIRLYFQACKFVCERVDGENFTTYKKVDVYVRAECDLYDWDNAIKNIQGEWVYAPLLSIAFHNMKHLKACGYFKDAYEVMSNLTPGYAYDVERFINAVKESCKGRR